MTASWIIGDILIGADPSRFLSQATRLRRWMRRTPRRRFLRNNDSDFLSHCIRSASVSRVLIEFMSLYTLWSLSIQKVSVYCLSTKSLAQPLEFC